MILDNLFKGKMFLAMRGQMDASALRQKVHAHNLANVNTPHFKRSEVNFEDAFKEALARTPTRLPGAATNPGHIPINPPSSLESVHPTAWRQNDDFMRPDDNNVDIDVEMSELAKNELMYNAVSETVSRLFRGLRNVITSR